LIAAGSQEFLREKSETRHTFGLDHCLSSDKGEMILRSSFVLGLAARGNRNMANLLFLSFVQIRSGKKLAISDFVAGLGASVSRSPGAECAGPAIKLDRAGSPRDSLTIALAWSG